MDTIEGYRQIVNRDVRPLLGGRLAASIVPADVQRLADTVLGRGARAQAKRAYESLRAILKWGKPRGYVTGEPWRGVELPVAGEARTRVLTAAELRWVWGLAGTWIADERTANQGRVLRLLLFLGQRSGEVNGMARAELSADLRTWTIPQARSKNGKEHAVPMPPMARQIVQEALAAIPAKQQHLFVGKRGAIARPDDLTHDLADALATHNADKPEDEQIAPFVPHDLRRTVATRLEDMGVAEAIISAMLNHISAKAASVTRKHYAHADLSILVREALAKWQGKVQRALEGDDPFTTTAERIDQVEARAVEEGYGARMV
jgi:integrase